MTGKLRFRWQWMVWCLLASPSTAQSEQASRWPLHREALRFQFRTAAQEILAYLPGDEDSLFQYQLTARGLAHITAAGALRLDHGSFLAAGQGKALLPVLQRAEGVSVEAWIDPGPPPGSRVEVLILGAAQAPLLALQQEGTALWLTLQTGAAEPRTVGAGEIPAEAFHFFASYEDGLLACWINGQPTVRAEDFRGDLQSWNQGELTLGGGSAADAGWRGTLQGISLYARPAQAGEAQANAAAFKAWLGQQQRPPEIRVRARLGSKSHVPSAAEVAPYRESMAVFEYEVLDVLAGEYPSDRVRVAHWILLDAFALPYGAVEPGVEVTLTLCPFDSLRHLRTVNLSDTLDFNFDLDLMADAGGLSTSYGLDP